MNDFIKINTLGPGANGARTENGAISYDTIGGELCDQFAKAGNFMNRSLEDVWADQAALWTENELNALKFPFYLRMITRQTNMGNGDKTLSVQKGLGLRDESFKRLLWIAKYHPDTFYKNLWVLPIVGSWKDLWQLMAFDGANEYLNHKNFFDLINAGLSDSTQCDLVVKYLPRIRSCKKCKTIWAIRTNSLAKMFVHYNGATYKQYREMKSTGNAHNFQRIICSKQYADINWKEIPGKALLKLVSGRFLDRHKLVDDYISWINTQPTVKFNGYPYELGRKLRCDGMYNTTVSRVNKLTIDKQFDNLIKTAKADGTPINGNVLCALDMSASMTWETIDKSGTEPIDVCLALGLYFSELNTGEFHNTVVLFSQISKLLKVNGTFSEKYGQLIQNSRWAYGSTNFQSVIDLLVDTRKKHPEIKLEDYPTTLLVVSDMQFNPTTNEKTNYQEMMDKLSEVFPQEYIDNFKVIWWYCTGGRQTQDFPSTMEHAGMYHFSGFDRAVISFILGGENNPERKIPTQEEIIQKVFYQVVLNLLKC